MVIILVAVDFRITQRPFIQNHNGDEKKSKKIVKIIYNTILVRSVTVNKKFEFCQIFNLSNIFIRIDENVKSCFCKKINNEFVLTVLKKMIIIYCIIF